MKIINQKKALRNLLQNPLIQNSLDKIMGIERSFEESFK